jgi:hypothetical protein
MPASPLKSISIFHCKGFPQKYGRNTHCAFSGAMGTGANAPVLSSFYRWSTIVTIMAITAVTAITMIGWFFFSSALLSNTRVALESVPSYRRPSITT